MGAAHHNGKLGKVVDGPYLDTGRYKVQLDEGGKPLGLKPANIRLVEGLSLEARQHLANVANHESSFLDCGLAASSMVPLQNQYSYPVARDDITDLIASVVAQSPLLLQRWRWCAPRGGAQHRSQRDTELGF